MDIYVHFLVHSGFFFNGNNSGCNVTQKWDNDVGFY